MNERNFDHESFTFAEEGPSRKGTDMTVEFNASEWKSFKEHLGMQDREGDISGKDVVRALNVRRNLSFSHEDRGKRMLPEDTPIVREAEKMAKPTPSI